jgi:hypothetical protein
MHRKIVVPARVDAEAGKRPVGELAARGAH